MDKKIDYNSKNNLNKLITELSNLVTVYIKDFYNKDGKNQKFNWKVTDFRNSFLEKNLDNSLLSNSTGYNYFGAPQYFFNIGNVRMENPIISAPMASISDNSYRIFARNFGCALTFTGMISSFGLYYQHPKTLLLAKVTSYERPCAVQIFGSEPDVMAEAAQKIEGVADIIDINMGCPAKKILKSKSGGYLLQDEDKIERIIKKVVSSVKKPITVKTRIGWDRNSVNIKRIASILEDRGVSAVIIHGRTVKQGFSGSPDYEIIKKVKKEVDIPVIISGDINSAQKAKEVLMYTDCEGLMIGRASRGRIWVILNTILFLMDDNKFKEIQNFEPSLAWKKEFAKLYLGFLVYFKGEDRAVKEFRKILGWIFRGVRDISRIRKNFYKITSFSDAVEVIDKVI